MRVSPRRSLIFSFVVAVALSTVLPAQAKSDGSKGRKRGKRAIGTVEAFDASTMILSVEFRDGSMFEGTLADNATIKVEHRGGQPVTRGNPTTGSVEDIDVGDKVLKLKARGGQVRNLRLRDVNSDVEDANGGECKDVAEEPAPEEPPVSIGSEDEGTGDDVDGSDGSEDELEAEDGSEEALEAADGSGDDSNDAKSCAEKAGSDDDAEAEESGEVTDEPETSEESTEESTQEDTTTATT